MVADGQDASASVNTSAAAKAEGEKRRLESLLLDDPDENQSVGDIATREIRVVSGSQKGNFPVLFGLLLCVIVLGTGYYFLFIPQALKPQTQQINLYSTPKIPVPVRPEAESPVVAAETVAVAVVEQNPPEIVDHEMPLFTVMVGPLIEATELERAINQLGELGLNPQEQKGRGQVVMIRLLNGIYPAEEARKKLAELKKIVSSAFILPVGDKMAVYAGSFHQQERALRLQDDLVAKKINVSLVDSLIPMNGTMLIALQADEKTAREVAEHISGYGFQTQVLKEK
ncbi:hypothetical protein [uncultured Desulfuromusa sp.]|uniref:hypothetical protein n=1 Tax=uncultured Desulfuromusa sp. TaxID=219183 RepID=UPI002AA629A9|nr:hypothetical protein [uncultured Desulfuromusa sp.]